MGICDGSHSYRYSRSPIIAVAKGALLRLVRCSSLRTGEHFGA
jgi:hypothetical protein